ncbi:hypothetical protein AMELA_G00269750 [Ameiurus melas]|uniref:B box-type domain-containing protein n=1 Tax=Ameiurus melas TaxID=219545 RepID=A0A7J5ZMZ2_AMEME|nr:hypothetical protein AMELA_G00269750 [Ameiurus melas]
MRTNQQQRFKAHVFYQPIITHAFFVAREYRAYSRDSCRYHGAAILRFHLYSTSFRGKPNQEATSTTMNLNNFVVLPNKPKSVKLNVRNLRELRMETAQLSQDNKDMESRLQQLREVMSHEKEEREKSGAFRWKSAQTHDGTRDKDKKLNKNSPSKMKIRVLKSLPGERVPEPPPPKDGRRRKSRLKGKVCGQCEARTAGLVCAECTEDYCVGCFTKFHQKGALRVHHIIPMQAELHTSISTLDVVNHFQMKIEGEEDEESGERGTNPECRTISTIQPVSHNQKHSIQVFLVNDADEENEDSLLRGSFDEEESSRSFQKALNEWRAGNTHEKDDTQRKSHRENHESNHNVQTARPASMEVMGTQAGGRTHMRIEFRDHGLSYMERLMLKKHRRTQVESYQLLSTPRSPQDPITDTCTQPVEKTHETHELTAEEMDLHHYCISLFAISSSAEETAGEPLVDASYGVKQRNYKKVNQGGDALAMPSQAEDVLHPTKPLDFSLKIQTLANETILSGPVDSFSESPPSDQLLLSLMFHKLQKSVDISTLTDSDILNTEQHKEHTFQEAQSPKLLKSQISRYPSKSKSTLKCTTQTQSSNTPSQFQPPSELQKSPLFSDNEEPSLVPLGSSSSKSEILQSSHPIHLRSNSDMSSDSVGMMPTDEDSSDEETRRCALQDMEEEEERNTFSFPPSLFPIADVPFPSQSPTIEEQSVFFTKPSLAVSSLAQRYNSVSTNYQGLDGFFTLGLDSRSVPLSLAPSHAPPEIHTHSTNSEAFMLGNSIWRPESSLLYPAEAKLVGVVINNQPISINSQSFTPISKMEPSWLLSQSGSSAPVTQGVSHPMCASLPISHAALEILEVQSLKPAEITHIKQDEEDLLAIASLEEEFKQMSAEPNLFVTDGHEDNRKWVKKKKD